MADPLSVDYPVAERRDLLTVINELARRYEDAPETWENRDLATYLDAVVRWIEDSDGYYRNRGEEPPSGPTWQFFADALRAGRVYE